MVNFYTQIPGCDSHSPAFLGLFISSNASICSTVAFPPLENFDCVSVSIDFPSNSKGDALFHHVTWWTCGDCDGLYYHLKDVPWEDILKFVPCGAASESCEWVQAETDA